MSELKLKNYSTQVSVSKSIMEIEKILASFGADAIIKEYSGDGRVQKLSFKINEKVFKLPANVNGVKNVMYGDKKRYYGRDSMKHRDEQAYRVAWRIIKDWIYAQLSLISSGQANPQEIFLPYMYDGKKTLYQTFLDEGKFLTEGEGK